MIEYFLIQDPNSRLLWKLRKMMYGNENVCNNNNGEMI